MRKLALPVMITTLILVVVFCALLLSLSVFGQHTYLISDGGSLSFVASDNVNSDSLLQELGVELGQEDTYEVRRFPGISAIRISRKQQIRVDHGGSTMLVYSYGETVGSLLNRLQLGLGAGDVLSVSTRTETYDGMVLTISKSVTAQETYTGVIDYQVDYYYDESLDDGEQKVLIEGREGLMQYTAEVRYVDGKEVSRSILSERVVSQPVNKVIAVGTVPAGPSLPELPTIEPSVQLTPEAPEAPARPIIGNGLIITPNGEVLTYTKVMQVNATAYSHLDPGCDMWTATGTVVHIGTVAVDPRMIPYGTRMYIVSNDGKYIYGLSAAEDCGGAIKGNRIDLYFPTIRQCLNFGRRGCTVYILG